MSEIFVRKQEIRPGKTERLREWVDEMYGEIGGDGAGVRDIWAEESLRTVSLFVEHAEDADYFAWYIEAESMERLIEAREASTHPLHELEDAMMAEVLVDPAEAGDFEPLLHGVSPERPDEFAVERYADGPR
jgi:hypothetical protein